MDTRTTMQLPRLDDSNFEFWKQSVRLIANATKITKFIENPNDISTIGDDDARKAVYLLANTMLLSMNDKTRRIATGAGKDEDLAPFEMMKRLEEHYLPNTAANDIQLRRQLYTMKWNSGTSIDIFANEIRALTNRINTVERARVKAKNGQPSFIGDRDMIAVLVLSLPNEYDTVVTLIERESDTMFEKAVEMVRAREQRLKIGQVESSSANSIQNGSKEKKFQPCDVCGKPGHSAAKCFKNGYRRGAYRGGKVGRGRGRRQDEIKASEIEEFPVNFMPAEQIEKDEKCEIANLFRRGREELVLLTPPNGQLGVVIDSGCSRHVCGAAFKKYLSNWRDGPEVTVRVADGSPHTSKKYADFRARVMTATGPQTITIKNVLFVDAIRSMLVSVSMLCSNGYTVDFRGNKCTLHASQGQTLEVMKKEQEQLFRLPLTSDRSEKQKSDESDDKTDKNSDIPNSDKNGLIAPVTKSMSKDILKWHNSLGHPGIYMMMSLSKNGRIPEFSKSDIADVISRCIACNMAKARALPVPEMSENRATKVMERIHCDAVTGLPSTMSGKTGFSLIVDEFSRFVDVRLITRKNETQDHIKEFVSKMTAEGHRVTKLRTDSAAEFVKDVEFKKWLLDQRIIQETSSPYAKHQNGVVERHIQTIEDRATALLMQSGLSVKYWGEAILCAVATWNATTGRKMSPLEAVTGRAGKLEFLKPFGCRVYIRTDGSLQKHMEPRAEMGIFLGYSGEAKGYRVSRDPQWRSIVIRAPRDCIFKEDEFPAMDKKNGSSSDAGRSGNGQSGRDRDDEQFPIMIDQGRSGRSEQPERSETPPLILRDRYYSSNFERSVTLSPKLGTRSGRDFHASLTEEINAVFEDDEDLKSFHMNVEQCDAIDDMINEHLDAGHDQRDVPRNISEAMKNPEAMEAAKREIEMIQKFGTWKLIPRSQVPSGTPIYAPIWRFTRKADGRMKARLCFPGHRQRKGIDYTNSSSPTVAMASFRLFLTYCKFRNVTPIHMDIRNAYLHAKVTEDIYMRQPAGFVDEERPDHVCKIVQSLYGMHQAGHNWHNLIDEDLVRHGLTRSEHDPCVYHRVVGRDKWVVICLYVDDLFIGGDARSRDEIIAYLKSKYNVSAEGEISRYLGVSVTTGDGPWKLDQTHEIEEFLKENQMNMSKPIDRPGDPSIRHEEMMNGQVVNQPHYRSVIGGLLWFAIATRPDILYAVNVVAQFQQNPTSKAWTAVKRIMRYLNTTKTIGIEIDPQDISLTVYCDANHGDPALGDRLSVSGGAYYLGGSLVHWTCRKQRTPAHSATESELIAASEAVREGIWLLRLGEVMGTVGPIRVHIDNKAAIDIANAKGLTRRVKHIEIRDAYIRILRERGIVEVIQVPSLQNRSDVLTKAFSGPDAFIHARNMLMNMSIERRESAGECCDTSSSRVQIE